MYYTYILKSKINASYYVGSCKDIIKRINLHNGGLVKSTKRYKPWEIVHKEEYESLSKARQRESQVKSWKKRITIENLIKSRIHDSFGGPMVQR